MKFKPKDILARLDEELTRFSEPLGTHTLAAMELLQDARRCISDLDTHIESMRWTDTEQLVRRHRALERVCSDLRGQLARERRRKS